jgi:hypothetical protein
LTSLEKESYHELVICYLKWSSEIVWEFFASDVGKVALGGLIAFAGQLVASLLAWAKEARFAASKKRKEAEYLAMRLVLVFDDLTNDCYNVVHDPLREDEDGCSESTVPDPKLTLPSDGDYKALPRDLMYEIISMPNKLDSIKEGMSSAADFSGPPDFQEFFAYREEHWSKFGLKALDLIDALCRQYKIPPPERPDFYTPRKSFQEVLMKLEQYHRDLSAENDRMVEQSLTDIFPDGMRPIISDGIRLLNFDDAKAAHALDAEQVSRNFREAALLDRQRRPSSGARIGQQSIP